MKLKMLKVWIGDVLSLEAGVCSLIYLWSISRNIYIVYESQWEKELDVV